MGATWLLHGDGSQAVWKFGPIAANPHSILFSLSMVLRVFSMGLLLILLFATTRPDDFCAALTLLRLPYRAAFVFSLDYRLVPAYIGLGQQIIEAQTCRGLDLGSRNLLDRLWKLCTVGVPLLVGAVLEAQLIHIALFTRAFDWANSKRIYYRQYHLSQADILALTVGVCVLFGSEFFRYFRWGML